MLVRFFVLALGLAACTGGSTDASPPESVTTAPGVEVAFADSMFPGTDGCARVSGACRVRGDALTAQTQQSDDSARSDAERARLHTVPVSSGKLAVTADRLTLYDENGTATRFTRPR